MTFKRAKEIFTLIWKEFYKHPSMMYNNMILEILLKRKIITTDEFADLHTASFCPACYIAEIRSDEDLQEQELPICSYCPISFKYQKATTTYNRDCYNPTSRRSIWLYQCRTNEQRKKIIREIIDKTVWRKDKAKICEERV